MTEGHLMEMDAVLRALWRLDGSAVGLTTQAVTLTCASINVETAHSIHQKYVTMEIR